MTTGTSRYRFEFRLADWAAGFSRSLCGDHRGFFVGFRGPADVRRLYVAPQGASFDGERKAKLAERYNSWFLYSPFDESGASYLEWLNMPHAVAERWLGRQLEAADFLDVRTTSAREGWPESWRVIVR